MQIQNEIKKSTKIIKEKNSFFSIMLNKIITIFSNETAELKASHPFTIFFNIWPYKMCVEVFLLQTSIATNFIVTCPKNNLVASSHSSREILYAKSNLHFEA